MNRKLFAFDMDGTVINSEEKINQKTVEAIISARGKGHKTAIVTGRPHRDVIRDIDENLFDYIVANNGAYFYVVKEKKFYYDSDLPKYLLEEAIKVGTENKCYIAVHGETRAERAALAKMNTNFNNNEFKEFEKFRDKFLSPKEIEKFGLSEKVMQISLRSDSKTINRIKNSFNDFLNDVDIYVSNEVYIDINLKGVNKWKGIEKVLNHLGEKYTIYAFGDSSNDLLMLEKSDFSYCMENGNAEAKKSAKKTIGNNDSNAIANVIINNI